MSNLSIDERIVEMRFDNQQFERGAQTTLGTLDKLKRSLKFDKAAEGLSELEKAGRGFSLSNVSAAAEAVANRFSTMGIAGAAAITRLVDRAMDAGERITKALTVDPVSTGFSEYETQINAVQTILSNTKKEGATLEDVNRTLDELNTYADQTIYNFTEMTRNIGTFTAAGVDLKTSTAAIKGIANLAAISGSTSQQASTAMYQLSQALSSGTVKLMDWNSVVNAGMGGAVFQDALKETARIHGIKIDEMIDKEGSFRETLQNGWLTSAILTETLQKFTGDLSESQLKALGYTEQQAKDIYELGQDANKAATKVKTFTQLFDTLKEAAQSGWSQSWRIVVGDFEEARSLLTDVSDAFGALINKTSESRNLVLAQWKDLGGRTALIESFKNVFSGLNSILSSVKAAFHSIFPRTTGEDLMNLTTKIQNATKAFKNLFWHKEGYTATAVDTSEGVMLEKDAFYQFSPTLQKFVKVFKSVFTVAKVAVKGVTAFGSAIFDIITISAPAFGVILDVLTAVCDAIANIGNLIMDTAHVGDWSEDLKNSLKPIIDMMPEAGKTITSYIKSVGKYIDESGMIQNGIGKVKKVFGDLGKVTLAALDTISKFVSGIWEYLKTNETFQGWIDSAKKYIGDLSKTIGDFYTNIVSSLTEFLSFDIKEYETFISELKSKFDKIKEVGDIPGVVSEFIKGIWTKAGENLKAAGDILHTAIEWLKEKVTAVVDFLGLFGINLQKVGGGVLLLAVGRFVWSMYSVTKAIGGVIGGFGESLGNITSTLTEFAKNKFIKRDTVGTTLLKIAGSIVMLVGAIWLLSTIKPEKLATGGAMLAGIAVGLFILAQALDTMNVAKAADFKKQTDALMKIGGAVIVLAGAIWLLGGMDIGNLGQGITALGGVLTELGTFLNLTKGAGYSLATNFFTMAVAIVAMTYAVKSFADMENLGDAAKGISVLGLVLGELGGFMKLTTGTGFAGTTSFFGLAAVLTSMVNIIKSAADIEVGTGAKGLSGIGLMLGELGVFMQIANGTSFKGGLNLIGLALAMNMLVPALEKMGALDLVTLTQGVGGLSTLFISLGGAMRLMGGLTGGFGSIIGIVVFAGALTIFADAMERLTKFSAGKMFATAGAFALAIGTFSGSFGILSAIPATAALNGIVTIAIAIGGIAAIISAMAGISHIPGFDWAMKEGGDALGKIGSAIGKFIQGIKNPDGASVAKEVDTNGFEKIGNDLNSLITNLQPFFDSVKNLDESVVTGVKNLSSILTTLIGASFWDRLLGWGEDTSALASFSKSLIPFGINMRIYAAIVKNLDNSAIVSSANAAQMLSDFASTLSGSRNIIAELLTDQSNIESFASGLTKLGPSLWFYSKWVSDINTDSVSKSANAAKLLAEFANELNSSTSTIDTIVNYFIGTNNIETFATGLAKLGPSLKTYASNINGISWTTVTKSANAAKLLSEFAVNLNNSTSPIDTLVGYFTGENKIATFANGLKELGPTLKQYATDVDGIDATAVENSANAAKLLVEFEKELTSEGGIFNAVKEWFTGEKSLVGFSEKIVTFGKNMTEFSGYFRKDDTTITDAISRVETILTDLNAIFGENGVSDFNYYNVVDLGFIIEQMTQSIDEHAPNFSTSGVSIMTAFWDGVSKIGNLMPTVMTDVMSRCLTAIRNYYYHFYEVGADSMRGLALGISNNAALATAAATRVAARTIGALNTRLEINSPSKEFEKSGMYSDMGLANGLMRYAFLIDESAKKVGSRAIEVMSTALSSIDSIVNSDLNFEPVITPVIDASQLAYGMNTVNGMFGNRMINVGGINAGVLNRTAANAANAMGQNGYYGANESARIAQAIDNLNGRMNEMTQTISHLKVVLDSGATVGQLKREFNRQLGRQMTHDERGL